jgi:hypothetical protein
MKPASIARSSNPSSPTNDTRSRLPTAKEPARIGVGSISVKAAWRILTDADPPSVRRRYYVVKDAEVLDVAKSLQTGANVCVKQDVALVGLH